MLMEMCQTTHIYIVKEQSEGVMLLHCQLRIFSALCAQNKCLLTGVFVIEVHRLVTTLSTVFHPKGSVSPFVQGFISLMLTLFVGH